MSAAACRGRRGDPRDTDYFGAGQRPLSKVCAVASLAKELGIELLYLPSYSPNLNLIERVWKFVKADCLRSNYYDNYGKFHAAIQQCLDDLPSKHKAAMDTLLTHNFQTFENVSLIAA